MKISWRTLGVALSVLVISCAAPQEQNSEQPVQTDENGLRNDLDFPPVLFDDGARWKANTETTDGIEKMIRIINGFEQGDDIEAYASLSEALNVEFILIFQKCTMKGEAHSQLHNYLLPMRIYFKRLESNDLEKCKTSFAELGAHLALYSEYFE